MKLIWTRRWRHAVVPGFVAVALGLAGCGNGGLLGSAKEAPDEFAVVSHTPLVIPPDHTLRPPRPGAPRPQDEQRRNEAASEVFGSTGQVVAARSPGEQSLLASAQALDPNPNIRDEIERQFSIYAHEDDGFFESLLFWQGDDLDGLAVDATNEAERLRENAALGKPANEGQTVVIEKQEKALLEDLF